MYIICSLWLGVAEDGDNNWTWKCKISNMPQVKQPWGDTEWNAGALFFNSGQIRLSLPILCHLELSSVTLVRHEKYFVGVSLWKCSTAKSRCDLRINNEAETLLNSLFINYFSNIIQILFVKKINILYPLQTAEIQRVVLCWNYLQPSQMLLNYKEKRCYNINKSNILLTMLL